MSCWGNLSPLQMALILIQIVAIPFLIGMILVYILFGAVWNESGRCGIFCCQLITQMGEAKQSAPQVESSDYINMDEYEEELSWQRRSAKFSRDLDQNEAIMKKGFPNPPIAALLENLYYDEENEKIFKCAIALISDSWALTTSQCVADGEVLTIQFNSDYWSKDGKVKKIKKILQTKIKNFILIKFDKIPKIVPFRIAKFYGRLVSILNWIGNNFDLPLNQRRKITKLIKFDLELFQKDDCSRYDVATYVSCYLASKGKHCGLKMHAPLINSYNDLLGIHLKSLCEENKSFAVVFYLDVTNYSAWLNETIGTNN